MSRTMSSKMTPAPWRVFSEVYVGSDEFGQIADLSQCDHDMPRSQVLANARAIAAVPRMVEALEGLNTMLTALVEGRDESVRIGNTQYRIAHDALDASLMRAAVREALAQIKGD